jgi:exonuclease III
MNTYKIATININGISHSTKIKMLGDFLVKQGIDIALVQEVTMPKIEQIHGYTTIMNIGSEMRGTAIITKAGLQATWLRRLPTGRGIAAKINDIHLVNIYAPSGAEHRQEREMFYNSELPRLLPTNECDLILAGDFNCTIKKSQQEKETPVAPLNSLLAASICTMPGNRTQEIKDTHIIRRQEPQGWTEYT